MVTGELPEEAVGLRLARIDSRDNLILCETCMFKDGRGAVQTTLVRASLAARVDIGGEIKDHFADVMDAEQSIIEIVALDAKSYSSLKNHWMRCKVDRPAPVAPHREAL